MKPQNWRFWHWQPFKGKHLWFCGCSKCALRCAFFPSVALVVRTKTSMSSLLKNMLAQLQTRELNFNFVCYLSFKKVFYHYYVWDYHWGLSPRLFVGCQVDLEDPDRFDGSLFFIVEALFVVQRTTCVFGNQNENWMLLHSNFAHTPRKEMNSFEFVGCDLSVRKTSTLIFSFQSNCFPKNFWLLQWNICLQGKHSFLLLWSWKKKDN